MSAQTSSRPAIPLTSSEKERFTALYLQLATQEFAEDLDRVRGADDFKNDALPVLIKALKQGTAIFSDEEKRRVLGAAREAVNSVEEMDVAEGCS